MTIAVTFAGSPADLDVFVADLDALGCTGVLEEEHALHAYWPAEAWTDNVKTGLSALGLPFETHQIEDQNWNAAWEASIVPVEAGPFLIKPTWTERPKGTAHLGVIEIDPKMSFGTGHHETTRLVLGFLPQWLRTGDRVLDAGTGTGVLGIGALKLGAAHVIGFDIDPWAQENVLENLDLNEARSQFEFREGAIDAVPEDGFDLILANINRNVLIDLVPVFAHKLAASGRLIL
ncbi:MAG: 50S ribosomal protein L11 methyltransferase, partial [Bacteroidota bacterium]